MLCLKSISRFNQIDFFLVPWNILVILDQVMEILMI